MPDMMPPPAAVLRPLTHLRQVAQQSPGLWQQLDHLRAGRGKGLPQWPDWCYLPLAGTVAALTQGAPPPDLRPLGPQIGSIGALAAWRVTQGIYRFDPTVFTAVWDTPLTGELPTALLYHLPEWCCYVPVDPARPLWQEDLVLLHGFFVHLEWDANTHHTALRFVLDTESPEGPSLLPGALHVQEAGGLVGALQRSFEVGGENLANLGDVEQATLVWQQSAHIAAQAAPTLVPLVSLTLYLCSQAADLQEAQEQTRRPTRPQPTKTKHGPRLFPPAQPTTWNVAYRLGAAPHGGPGAWVTKTRKRHAVREMQGGPAQSPWRGRLQTARSCCGHKPWWCTCWCKSVTVHTHGWMRETSASEPPMRHRNTADDIKTGVPPRLWEQHGGNLLTGHVVSGVQEA